MKNKPDFEKQADQTLNSLDNLQQIESNDFLHTKKVHRMEMRNVAPATNTAKLLVRLVVVLCLFACLNIATYFALQQPVQTTIIKSITSVDAFADAYGLNNNLNIY